MVSFPKVLHLVISLAPGGLERLVVDWTNVRNRRMPGSTRIGCLDELGELVGQVEGCGEEGVVFCVNAKRSRWPFDSTAVRFIRYQFLTPDSRLLAPNVIHAHNMAAWQYAVLAKVSGQTISSPVCVVYTQHGANVHNLNLRDRIRARILAFFTDEIVAVSSATADGMAARFWIPRRRIRVVVNGVAVGETTDHRSQTIDCRPQVADPRGPPEEVKAPPALRSAVCGLRSAVSFPAGALVIGTVGRLAQVKGHDRLIAAFAEVKQLWGKESFIHQSPITNSYASGVFLLLVGDGHERAALEKQAHDLGVSEQVIFAGYQADPQPFYAMMDLFVLPSRSEGVSVALLEAMASGVPVAVTDVGANREVVEDGKCGVILPDDEAQWGGVFAGIFKDHEGRQRRRAAAVSRVRSHYSLEVTLEGYEKLYAGV